MTQKTHYQLCQMVIWRGFAQKTTLRYVPCGSEGVNHEDRYDYMVENLPDGFMGNTKEEFLELGVMPLTNNWILTIVVDGLEDDNPAPVLAMDDPFIQEHKNVNPSAFSGL